MTTSCSRIFSRCAIAAAIAAAVCLVGPVAGAGAQAPPETVIDSGPAGPTNDNTATFTFSSPTHVDAAFECWHTRPGAAREAVTPCEGSVMLSGLEDGDHVFEVAARHAVDGLDETPAERIFTVDTTAPGTVIAAGPAGLSNDPTPEFNFASPDPGATFECRHHPAGEPAPQFAPCGSPYKPGRLGDGSYVFEVVAVDGVGHRDATPAAWSYQVDTTPPQSEITAGPADSTAATAVFLFSAPGAAALSCRLDGGTWSPCGSPQTYQGLSLGPHTFEVTAVDAAGNSDSTPAHHAWQVLKPGLVIPSAVKQATALAKELVQIRRALAKLRLRTLARRRTVLFRSFDALTAGTVAVSARARIRQGGRRRWVRALKGRREVPDAGRHRIRARVTKKGRRLARRRQRLPLELRLSFTDRAGRSLWATSKLTLKR